MAAPRRPNTRSANEARRDPLGRVSKPVRVLAPPEVHEWLKSLSPGEIGQILTVAKPPQARVTGGA